MGQVITIQADILYIVVITAILCVFCYMCGNAFKKAEVMDQPKGLVNVAMILVDTVDGMVVQNTSKERAKTLAPYILALAMYLVVCNWFGLTGFPAPTANYSVTLSLAFITFVLKEREAIKTNGWGDYIKGFFDPIPPFVIPNFFGMIAPLISMSLRLFGNLLSGTIILTLVYAFTGWVSSMVPVIGTFNFVGPLLAPFLHAYFDVFSGFIQMFIFITLTQVFIGNNLPSED